MMHPCRCATHGGTAPWRASGHATFQTLCPRASEGPAAPMLAHATPLPPRKGGYDAVTPVQPTQPCPAVHAPRPAALQQRQPPHEAHGNAARLWTRRRARCGRMPHALPRAATSEGSCGASDAGGAQRAARSPRRRPARHRGRPWFASARPCFRTCRQCHASPAPRCGCWGGPSSPLRDLDRRAARRQAPSAADCDKARFICFRSLRVFVLQPLSLRQAAENAERRELFPVRKKSFDRGFEGSGRRRL